jgi:hypothetical protein
MVKKKPRYSAGLLSWMYNCEKTIKYPFDSPMRNLATYRASMVSVVIMMTVDTTHSRDASQRQAFRPSLAATKPAVPELTHAPRSIRDVMSCCRVVDMFQPMGVLGAL